VVDVAGAVPRPGVYEFPVGSRVKDAVEAAGGLLAQADKTKLNLAAPLEDGARLDIPFLAGLEPTQPAFSFVPGSNTTNNNNSGGTITDVQLIDINTASATELDTLPGIGPTLAQAIIDYRETYGPFFAIEDIMFVDGIGPDTFEAIKDLITVGF
jgi:competence protein ComEA